MQDTSDNKGWLTSIYLKPTIYVYNLQSESLKKTKN